MVFATVAGGALMYAVHFAARRMPQEEYGVFVTLLQVLNLMGIPALGLQSVFAQQAVDLSTDTQRHKLAGTVRGVAGASLILWLVIAAGVAWWSQDLLASYKIRHPWALVCTVFLGLVSLWQPVVAGLLQGRQNFLWLGLLSILNAAGRLALVLLVVVAFGFRHAGGAMTGVVVSMFLAVGVTGWQTRDLFLGPAEPIEWGPWLKRVVPLTLGLGSSIFMFAQDMLTVQRFFPESETGYYGAAGMIGRALVFLVLPVGTVIFPKIVQSAARAEKTNVMFLALGTTALLGGAAALFCTLFPTLPIRIVQGSKYLQAAPLVPWFAWCMLPLGLSNLLLNNLMARERYAVVPWAVLVAAGYSLTLWFYHPDFLRVIQTLGGFGLLLLAVCAWFTWRGSRQVAAPAR